MVSVVTALVDNTFVLVDETAAGLVVVIDVDSDAVEVCNVELIEVLVEWTVVVPALVVEVAFSASEDDWAFVRVKTTLGTITAIPTMAISKRLKRMTIIRRRFLY